MVETQAEPGELWAGPFPMLPDRCGAYDSCLVERGAPYKGPGLYAVAFANGVENVCRLERKLDRSRVWRVLPEGAVAQELEETALRVLGRVQWIFRPAPNFRHRTGSAAHD